MPVVWWAALAIVAAVPRASDTLDPLLDNRRAAASSSSAARRNASSVAGPPSSSASAIGARQGLCVTPPSAIRTSRTTPSSTRSAAATDTSAKANEARSQIFRYSERVPRGGSSGSATPSFIRSTRFVPPAGKATDRREVAVAILPSTSDSLSQSKGITRHSPRSQRTRASATGPTWTTAEALFRSTLKQW